MRLLFLAISALAIGLLVGMMLTGWYCSHTSIARDSCGLMFFFYAPVSAVASFLLLALLSWIVAQQGIGGLSKRSQIIFVVVLFVVLVFLATKTFWQP